MQKSNWITNEPWLHTVKMHAFAEKLAFTLLLPSYVVGA